MNLSEMHIKAAAKAAAGNWKKYDSFVWFRANDLDDADNWAVIYTHNRDAVEEIGVGAFGSHGGFIPRTDRYGNATIRRSGREFQGKCEGDEWHFRQQLLRYGSGLHLVIDDQEQLDDFVRHGWLKLTDTPIPIHRIKVDLHQALDWEDDRREALVACLDQWRDGPHIKYSIGHRCDYYFECRGNEAAEHVRSKLREFGLVFETWGPQPDMTPISST